MPIAPASRALLALTLSLAGCACAAADLGTLFNSAEERARLDKLRRGEAMTEAASEAPGAPPMLTGFVQRSDGRSTVWINGRPVGVVTPKASPPLDPKAVRAYSENPEGVKVERKGTR